MLFSVSTISLLNSFSVYFGFPSWEINSLSLSSLWNNGGLSGNGNKTFSDALIIICHKIS